MDSCKPSEAALLQDDLRELLRLLGMNDGAQPRSPHDVFQAVLAELRNRLPSPVPVPVGDDPSTDERWQAGLDFGLLKMCAVLGVKPKTVRWDTATETLDGDVSAVIRNILRTKYGDDFDPAAASPPADMRSVLEPFAKAAGEADISDREWWAVKREWLRAARDLYNSLPSPAQLDPAPEGHTPVVGDIPETDEAWFKKATYTEGLEQFRDRVQTMAVSTLMFYGNPQTYQNTHTVPDELGVMKLVVAAIERDKGKRARDALLIGLPRWRHKARGTTYYEIGRGNMHADGWFDESVVIYAAEVGGSIWVRPVAEFEDGRFERVEDGTC